MVFGVHCLYHSADREVSGSGGPDGGGGSGDRGSGTHKKGFGSFKDRKKEVDCKPV